MKSLIIFAGAGASRGVSGEKYPMALDFKERLTPEIKNSQLYTLLIAFLSASNPEVTIDIEHVLWELGRLSDIFEALTNEKHFAASLFSSNQINNVAPGNTSGQVMFDQFGRFKSSTIDLQNKINELVYEYYSQEPDIDELNISWLPLLKQVSNSGFNQIDIVTTNYDLVIESALRNLQDENQISMGITDGNYPQINLEEWRTPNRKKGLLTKLHGSVDWKLGRGGTELNPTIRRGHPEFDGDHGKRLILYPGFKGVPTREPFATFHDYFRSQLKQTTHLLFIGFAFRDDFINELITTSIDSSCQIAVVNPADKLPKQSFLKKALHIRQGFGVDPKGTILGNQGISPFDIKELKKWLSMENS